MLSAFTDMGNRSQALVIMITAGCAELKQSLDVSLWLALSPKGETGTVEDL